MTNHSIEHAARMLALENGKSESSISKIYWFPDQKEIRLVEVDTQSIKSQDELVHPFYFNPIEGIPYPSGIALIHPDEERNTVLPPEWGDWSQAVIVFEREAEAV